MGTIQDWGTFALRFAELLVHKAAGGGRSDTAAWEKTSANGKTDGEEGEEKGKKIKGEKTRGLSASQRLLHTLQWKSTTILLKIHFFFKERDPS